MRHRTIMDMLEADYPTLLRVTHAPPCISIYQPTHRHHPDNEQDPIRFRNLVKSVEGALRRDRPARDVDALLAPLRALDADHAFWNHTLEGLAVLAAPGFFRSYRLQRPVRERAIVAGSFHTKPLLRILQSADRFQILALARGDARLFEGNRDALAEIDPAPGVPRTIADALGDGARDRERTNRVYGAVTPGGTTRHGTGSPQDDQDQEIERYFRAVDRAVTEHHSQPTGLPLLLAALPEHHHLFRRISRNPMLSDAALDVHPGDLSIEELRERAWQLLLPSYLSRLAAFTDAFHAAKARNAGSDDVAEVAKAVAEGRVAALLIDADREIPGRLDADGAVARSDSEAPGRGDVLDDLGEEVLRSGGEVVVVPAGRMPTATGLAATYRY